MGQNVSLKKEKNGIVPLPLWIDLRQNEGCPKILNEETLNCSGSNALSNIIRFWLRKQGKIEYQPSRLYMYYFGRLLDNNTEYDSGVCLKKLFKGIEKFGICSEKNWPYDIDKFNIKPDSDIPKENINNFKYYSVKNNINELKLILSYGYPIICMLNFFDNNSSSEIIEFPKNKKNKKFKTISIYGYRNSSNMFICMNSVGTEWGEKGFFYVPYKYMTKYGYDFYTITL